MHCNHSLIVAAMKEKLDAKQQLQQAQQAAEAAHASAAQAAAAFEAERQRCFALEAKLPAAGEAKDGGGGSTAAPGDAAAAHRTAAEAELQAVKHAEDKERAKRKKAKRETKEATTKLQVLHSNVIQNLMRDVLCCNGSSTTGKAPCPLSRSSR